jgi:hypothetical protein
MLGVAWRALRSEFIAAESELILWLLMHVHLASPLCQRRREL